ncbi:restriction endonuclease subunit S [Clostridium saccharobutylicum]|uniref:Type-1 restriction enzyme MjaXIP specificity protein n=2 Tax=Clostridium saccharobutylicum TaxID=169679 RepID=U5MTR9_CLOSA|nr:restriction endonuclease subunit S [Clostridium saccharobutylicum]AGX43903.1 type-1 restriction enzyme MjaXIP specificity protein [Clostridium saccharobutylicum DSM 13864]AQR91200.1 type-1 restriction enzyme EcoKI specificity protein [Clostridium saccharobutylicum]AQS01104.1 type-1 restriction enzyme EcoKI specificity protein [Clostridium saccharobutylicum]AQS15087.1 type-1 restriction enzyme EcoKI specificity protein [Clostridium saccharobutylicum]MBA2905213.1 type I restriction enzyme S s
MKKVKEGYKMTELGEIPNSWKVEKIGNIFDFYGGISISRDKQSENGVYYLHYGDIHKKNRNYFSVKEDSNWLPKIEIDINDLKEGILLNTGDVVFADASEDYEGIGKSVVIINEKNEDFVSGLHTIVAKDKGKELDTLYKKYCFGTTEVRKQFRTLATGATVYGISRSNIKDIKILVPTIEEQEQIALTLSSVDEQIEITDNLIEKTKELKKGLMQKLLTRGIGHSRFKDTEIGRIPEEWEIENLGDVTEIVRGASPRPKGDPKYYGGNVPRLMISDVTRDGKYVTPRTDFLTEEGAKKSRPMNKGDLIISISGTVALPTFLAVDSCIHDGFMGFKKIDEKLNKDFLYYQILFLREKLIRSATDGGVYINLTTDIVKEFKIIIPPLEEQNQIYLMLSSLDEQIDQYKEKKEKLQELKKGLIQKLLTGKIRV